MRRDPWRPRLGWPLVLLAMGLGCIGLALVEAQRSSRSNQAVAERVLTGYADLAAWSYTTHLTTALRNATQEVLGGVNMLHTTPPVPNARVLGHGLRWDIACACHRPRYGPMPAMFLGFTLGSDTLEVGHNQAPAELAGWLVDPVTPLGAKLLAADSLLPSARHWLVDTLTTIARGPRAASGYQHLIARVGDSTLYIALTRMPTSWGDTLIYAVQYRPAVLDSMLNAILDDRSLLPGGRLRNRDVIAIDVQDAEGRALFKSRVPERWALDATSRLPAEYGGLTIRTEIRPEVAGDVIIGGLPRSRLPLLLGLLVLAAGLTGIAVLQLRREERFANERSTFVASVSHELRTPLAQIRLASDTLRLGREPDSARRDATWLLVDREITRLQHLVDSVLHFTRGRAPLGPVSSDAVDVAAETRSVVADFAPLAVPRHVSIVVRSAGAPTASLRPGVLRQVLLNLLDNAVKYGPDGQTIEVDVTVPSNGGARLTVRDQGPGVLARDRERIWQPFQRGSVAAERAVGGSGIGLTVVREIAEQHGGSATVAESETGGAIFILEFPEHAG